MGDRAPRLGTPFSTWRRWIVLPALWDDGSFHFLKIGLAVVLLFVGAKMIASAKVHVPIPVALGVVAGVLGLSVVASLLWPQVRRQHEKG